MKPIEIKLSGPIPNSNKFFEESKEIGAKIREAAELAKKYEHYGTAQWLENLAKEFEKETTIPPFKELL